MKRDVFSDAIIQDLRKAGVFEADQQPKVPATVQPAAPAKQVPIKPLAQPQPKPAEAPIDPDKQEPVQPSDVAKVQSKIYQIKLRMSKLAVKTMIKKFLISYQDFDTNVTKNKNDLNKIRSYVAPVKGDVEALRGALESLEVELDALDKMLGED